MAQSRRDLFAFQPCARLFVQGDVRGNLPCSTQIIRLRIGAILQSFAPACVRFAGEHEAFESIGAAERIEMLEQLEQRGRKFLEPPPNLPMAKRGDIDLVVVPAVAVAANGHRLGYGSGFYDAPLPDVCPPATLLAVVFDFQLLGELPVEEHDVPVHIIATDQRVLRAAGE